MAADNTILNPGTAGDTIRDLARLSGSVKTQVIALDLGGAASNAENLITAGQQTMANSMPVAIASNQPAIPVSLSSSPLPTGAATETTLAAASAKLPATLGQKAMTASMAVALASDQASIPVAATLAAETTKVIGTVNIAAAQSVATTQADTNITGTISATDVAALAPKGDGVLIGTAPTVNSYVAAALPGGTSQSDIQILGTATGTYYFESSMDSTNGSDGNWTATNYRLTGVTNTQLGYSTTVGGVFRGAPSGFKYVRVRNVGGTTPNNAIIFRYSANANTTFLNASIPSGANIIGYTRPLGVDASGAVQSLQTNQLGQLIVKQAPSTVAETGIVELLTQINAASVAQTHLLTQLVALMNGQFDPPQGEDADSLIGEILDRKFIFKNLTN